MKSWTEKLRLQLALFAEASSARRGAFRRARTYLAKIAIVLQDAPGQMLMFRQLMTKIVLLTSEDQKCVKNNIRVCLSTNKCFVKVPVIAESNHSKRNYWKLDCGQITAKMVRRHFRGLLQLFPELAPKVGTKGASSKPPDQHPARQSPDPAACKAAQVRCQVKFSGPFSIESLLRRDSPSGASPRPGVQIIRAEQQQHRRAEIQRGFSCYEPEGPLFLHPSAGCSSICPAGGSRFMTVSHRLRQDGLRY